MRESIGSALLLNIVIVIVGVISAFLIGSIAYSKAFKVKSRIIEVIDEFNGNCASTDDCFNRIEEELVDMGYSSNINTNVDSKCPKIDASEVDGVYKVERVYPETDGLVTGHMFCVYRYYVCTDSFDSGSDKHCRSTSFQSHYYKVRTFMHFDIPVIGSFLEFPVEGETKNYIDKFSN